MRSVFLTLVLLATPAVARMPVSEALASEELSFENLKTYSAGENHIAGVSGVIHTGSCTDAEGARRCLDQALDRATEASWALYGVSEEHRTDLRVERDIQVDDYFHVVKLQQEVDGIPVYGGYLTVVTNPENDVELLVGELVGFSGKRRPVTGDSLSKTLSSIQNRVKASFSLETAVSFEGRYGRAQTLLNDNASLEQLVSPDGETVHIYRGEDKTLILREGIVEEESAAEAPANKPAYVPIRRMTNADEWYTSTRIYDYEYVGYDYNLGTGQCTYMARYDHSSVQVNRVDDQAYSDASYTGSCSTAPFVYTNSSYAFSDYREWDVLWRMKQHQLHINSHVYPSVTGGTPTTLNVAINSSCSGTPTACYVWNSNTAKFDENSPSNSDPSTALAVSTIGHEFGHHLHYTYGFEDFVGCATYNHRTLVMQWMATAIGNTLAAENHVGVSYDYNVFDRNVFPHWEFHNDGAYGPDDIYEVATSSCNQDGNKLTQPIWEIIHNADCTDSLCEETISPGGDVGSSYSKSYLQNAMLKALAFAALVQPTAGGVVTIQSAAASVKAYLYTQLNSAGDAAVLSIFAHHGL